MLSTAMLFFMKESEPNMCYKPPLPHPQSILYLLKHLRYRDYHKACHILDLTEINIPVKTARD